MFNKKYYVYILTNKRNNVFYVGITSNLEHRIIEHKNKLTKSFTSKYNINKLVYYEEYQYVNDAIYREKQLKKWRRHWKIELINKDNPCWHDLSSLWHPLSGHPELDSGSRPTITSSNEMPDPVRHDKKDRPDKKIKALGKYGEQVARQYLTEKGYKILEKNFYTRYGEIDLICRKENQIIFVEVKTRSNLAFGWPEESINAKKIESLIACAEIYMQNKKQNWSIDVISIIFNQKNNKLQIKHLKNIEQ